MLNLPNRTKTLLEQNAAYHGFVLSCQNNLNAWLSDNKTVFFPEYTDHGFTHLNEVLLTADSIISDESWPHMTAQDAAAMIVSVLLHDCAMHLTEDGFYSLIQDKLPRVESRHIETEPRWSEVWHEYISEAKRFDATKLRSIFGDETPVREIPKNKIDLSGRDRLLIGEFIRRNHARIAHEIAFYGVPGVDGQTVKLGKAPEDNFLDVCGFIARSHNMGLRSAVDKIEKRKRQVHLNAHVPFLMLVLRIADYIQIHAERAPKQLLHLKTLVSPISKGEWKKHHSIVEINQAHEDPEAIYVDAEPKDALSYVELKKLFSDIQLELDLSWSVLGEVYGRYDHLKELGITIRRIKSSLDYIEEFVAEKKPNYIPKVLSFRTADSEMMELLIKPLYGDKPEVGIRELVQNAVDACAELRDLQVKQGRQPDDNLDYDVCVTLHDLNENGGRLVIEDRGIGMTLDVVENYFLNIGASFRNSDRWKKEHETDGHSKVYRTGRFGIGLLAAYLLGDKLRVETRHVSQNEDQALTFECVKGSKKIIVAHTNFHVGTRITIDISEKVKQILIEKDNHWDWFSLEKPKVIRKIVEKNCERTLEQSRRVPSSESNIINTEWHRTIDERYDDITWTYNHVMSSRPNYRESASLICNGIIITEHLSLDSFGISEILRFIHADTPTINVFDQDGRLPINLERSDIIGRNLPFKLNMAKDISKYLAKEILKFCNTLEFDRINANFLYDILNMNISGLAPRSYGQTDNVCKFLVGSNSLIPIDYNLIFESKIEKIYIDGANLSKSRGAWTSTEFLNVCDNYLLVDKISDTKQSRSAFVRAFFELIDWYTYGYLRFSALPIRSRRILIKKSDVKEIVSPGYVPKSFWNRIDCEWENDNWVLMSVGAVPPIDFDAQKISSELDASKSFGVIICYLDWGSSSEAENRSHFSDAWIEENGSPSFTIKTKGA
ncbi:HD domain-containing protein [Cellvibrio sp.]